MEETRGKQRPSAAGPRRPPREEADARAAEGPGARPAPANEERHVLGAETSIRRISQGLALLLWIPVGFLFWVPFLLRRTVAYVLAVLYAGLVGGQPARAARGWRHAVGFYRLGFRRIAYAFRPAEERFSEPHRDGGKPESGVGRVLFEVGWALAVWAALLWITGLWPDAPAAVAGGLTAIGDTAAEATRSLAARTRALLGG